MALQPSAMAWSVHVLVPKSHPLDGLMSAPVQQDLDYAWEVATLYPVQGDWTEDEYLSLTDSTNLLIEFVDGRLEFLPTTFATTKKN